MRLSQTTLHVLISPNLEKMSSRASLFVTLFILQINKTFSGGRASASGKSPIISRVPVKNVSKSDALSNIVEKFRKVSGRVWVSFEAVIYREHIKKRNERIKIIFTIITTLLL